VDGIGIRDPFTTFDITLAQPTAASAVETGVLGQPIVMQEGWTIQLRFVGGATDGDWATNALINRLNIPR